MERVVEHYEKNYCMKLAHYVEIMSHFYGGIRKKRNIFILSILYYNLNNF